jgi:phosphomethylpyrimidine synthase
MRGPNFSSMKIAEEVRKYAEEGMRQKREEFRKAGCEIYQKA